MTGVILEARPCNEGCVTPLLTLRWGRPSLRRGSGRRGVGGVAVVRVGRQRQAHRHQHERAHARCHRQRSTGLRKRASPRPRRARFRAESGRRGPAAARVRAATRRRPGDRADWRGPRTGARCPFDKGDSRSACSTHYRNDAAIWPRCAGRP